MKIENKASEQSLRLEIDSHVVRQLGEELITDTGQALLELIKNCYDADGDWAKVRVDTDHIEEVPSAPFVDDKKDRNAKTISLKGVVSIADNGHGMALDAIQKGWLMISLSPKRAFKAEGRVTARHKRTPVGDKGLGRLGTMKLGNYVVIETYTDPAKKGHRVSFFWSDCVSGSPLSKVPVQLSELPANGKTGTTLSIYGLRDIPFWQNQNSLSQLEMQLSTLISPFKAFEGFIIEVTVNGRSIETQNAESYLKTAQHKYELVWIPAKNPKDNASLEMGGQFKLSLFRTSRNDDFYDKYVEADNGKALFTFLSEHKDSKPWKFEKDKGKWFVKFIQIRSDDDMLRVAKEGPIQDPGPLLAEIYSFDFNEAKSALAPLMKRGSTPKFIEEHTGVFVFRDNFRIRMGEDWLGLGKSWTTGGSYYGLKPKNTLGWVALTARDNQQLIEKSDREGFIDNPAKRGFDYITAEFRDLINKSLEVLRRTYIDFKRSIENKANEKPDNYSPEAAVEEVRMAANSAADLGQQAEQQKQAAQALNDTTKDLNKLASQLPRNSKSQQEIKRLSKGLQEAVEKIKGVSKAVPVVLKQIKGLSHAADTISARIEQHTDQSKELYEMSALGLAAQGLIHELQPCIDEMTHSIENVKTIIKAMQVKNPRLFENIELSTSNAQAIGNRIKFLDPMMRTYRSVYEEINVHKFLNDFAAFKELTLASHGIKINVRQFDDDFMIKTNRGRLTQVFDNLIRNSEYWLRYYSKKHPGQHAIDFKMKKPYILVSDDGFGIDKKLEDILFDLFVSGKPSGEGHGLGLFLVKELLEEDECDIVLLPERNCHGRRYIFQLDLKGVLNGK
jgi:signal transduction histidine kinase